jgi:hypothetical protein
MSQSTSSPTPPDDTSLEECISLLKKKGIKVVVFDMDNTAVAQHSRGSLLRSELNGYLDMATPDFRSLTPLLHKNGFSLAIATHSDEAEFNGEIQPRTHILGAELATSLLQKHFSPEIVASFFIVAYNPRVHPEDDSNKDTNLIKRYHMRCIVEHFQIQPKEILFFDDTHHVVEDCISTCKVIHSFLVDPHHGFRLTDLTDNLK